MANSHVFRYRADVLTLSVVVGYVGFLAASWVLYPLISWHWVVLLVVAHCFYQFIIATIIHNTIHVPLFYSKHLNRGFQFLLSLCHGHPVSGFVPGHNLSHHKHLQTPKDSARTNRAQFRWNILNQALFFFLLMFEIMASEQRFVRYMRNANKAWAKQYTYESLVVFGFKLIVLILDWQRAILLVILPNFYGTWGIFGTNYWQHDGCDHLHAYNHSRSFTGKLFNALTFNNGFHAIHHMRPEVHWSLYPAHHAKEVEPYNHPNLNQPSLLVYLWRTLIYPGKRVDYLGNPIILNEEKLKSEDWVKEVVDSKDTRLALGAIQD
jgi:beta-carotene hydroxylase